MTNNTWIITLLIVEFITGCGAYYLGRSNRDILPKRPKLISPRFCQTEYDPRFTNHCFKLGTNCIHGFCKHHCIQFECNCTLITEEDKEILLEVKQITER